jgi:integral membrane protein
MNKFFTTNIGRFRLLAFLEGMSLIALVFIGMPMKYMFSNPVLVKSIGPLHGLLFLFYVAYTFAIAAENEWKFTKTTWIVLLASFVPFGTFYIDHTILKKIAKAK